MPPLIVQLEQVVRELLTEHQNLLKAVENHLAALRTCRVAVIENAAREQDLVRMRIGRIEQRRRSILAQLLRQHRNISRASLDKLAELYPDRRAVLLQLRAELTRTIVEVHARTQAVARVAAGVLTHLNATVKLVAAAAAGPSTYSRTGAYQMPSRPSTLATVG